MAQFSACLIIRLRVCTVYLSIKCWFQTNEQISSQKGKNSEQEEIYKVKKKTLDLLPDAENNVAKLQVIMKYTSSPFDPFLLLFLPFVLLGQL